LAPLTKVANCRELGAEVIVEGNNFSEATAIARNLGKERGLTYIHGFDHPAVIAGQVHNRHLSLISTKKKKKKLINSFDPSFISQQGSVGLEILEQVPDVDAVIVPVGGGGLIAGISLAIKNTKPDVKIYGVEPTSCAVSSHHLSLPIYSG
jgi:threonine dehydratase